MTTEEQAKAIQELAHKWIDAAEKVARDSEKKDDDPMTFEQAAIGDIFMRLAMFEIRLRKLERDQGRADDFLNMHTPIR